MPDSSVISPPLRHIPQSTTPTLPLTAALPIVQSPGGATAIDQPELIMAASAPPVSKLPAFPGASPRRTEKKLRLRPPSTSTKAVVYSSISS
jgi:hypothetical protein